MLVHKGVLCPSPLLFCGHPRCELVKEVIELQSDGSWSHRGIAEAYNSEYVFSKPILTRELRHTFCFLFTRTSLGTHRA